MEKVTDWLLLWRQLAESMGHIWKKEDAPDADSDNWKAKARSFSEGARKRQSRPDLHRDFILSTLQANPGSTVLDVGAGTGGWAIPMARHARKVTALEPSPAMLEVLEEAIAEEGVRNIEIVRGGWPDTRVDPHDYSLCSHAMYGAADFRGFVGAMGKATRKTCMLLMRAPDHDGLMAQLATRIWGQPYDSTDFQVAYNALLQMGIFGNVLMGPPGQWDPWSTASFDEAVEETMHRFKVTPGSGLERYVREMLGARLTERDGRVCWPAEVRSALIYWEGSAGG